VIEPRTALTFQGFEMVGPGVWVRGFEPAWRPRMLTAEQVMSVDQILFSENLLALEMISYIFENPAVKYWQRMRPLGRAVRWQRGEVAPLVVYSLSEWKVIQPQIQGVMFYLVPLGRIWEMDVEKVVMDVKNEFTWREIYEVPWTSPFQEDIKRFSHWVKQGQWLMFLFSYVGKMVWVGKDRSVSVQIGKERRPSKQVVLLGIDRQGVMLKTCSTLIVVDLVSYESVKFFEFYAHNVGLDLSCYKLPVFEKKLGVDETIKGFKKVKYVVDPDKHPVEWAGIYLVSSAMMKDKANWRKMK